MDAKFLQDICVSLQSDPLALKFKSHSEIPRSGDVQDMDSQNPEIEIIDSASPNLSTSCPRIHRSHGGETPRDDTDPRFQFQDGLLYYQGLLYVPEGPCRLQVLQS